MFDVAFTAVQGLDFFRIHVKAQDIEAFFGEADNQGEADIAKSDNTNLGFAGFDLLNQ